MAKIDKIKEQIGWLKVLFGLLFATDISLIAYLFNKIEMLSAIKVFCNHSAPNSNRNISLII